MRARYSLGLAISLSLPSLVLAQNWKDSLKTQLAATVAVTKTSSDRLRITNPGTVLIVQQGGISASPGKDATYLNNNFRDGEIQQAKGLAAALVDKKTNRDFKVGEKVYATDIDVNDNDITLLLAATETDQISIKGNTQQTRYKASLKLHFPKDSLQTMPFENVKKVLTTVLQLEGVAEAPKTVELGQSMTDVEAAMGKPESIIKLGPKTIYVYKAFKVTFVDGKVTDVQ